MDTPSLDLIGRAEAARILSVSQRHVGRLPLDAALRLPGNRGAVLYRRDDVVELAREREAAE